MKHMTRRTLSLLLTLAMLFSLAFSMGIMVSADTYTALGTADSLTAGSNYLITGKQSNNVYVMYINGSSVSAKMVNLETDDLSPYYWTYGSDGSLQNGGKYLNSSYTVMSVGTAATSSWTYSGGNLYSQANWTIRFGSGAFAISYGNPPTGYELTVYAIDGGDEPEPCLHEHTMYVAAVAPTCAAEGRSEYWYCLDCGSYFADEELTTETTLEDLVVPATGNHTFAANSNICTVCGNYALQAVKVSSIEEDGYYILAYDDEKAAGNTSSYGGLAAVDIAVIGNSIVTDDETDIADLVWQAKNVTTSGINTTMQLVNYSLDASGAEAKYMTVGYASAGVTDVVTNLIYNGSTLYYKGAESYSTAYYLKLNTTKTAVVGQSSGGYGTLGIYQVTLGTHTHNYVGEVTTEATCQHTGVITYTCTGCGDTYTEVLPRVDHVFENGECKWCGITGQGTESNPYMLSTAQQLKDLASAVNEGDSKAGKYYKLANDITLDGTFTPIGQYVNFAENAFAGHFDGNGKTVTMNTTDQTGSDARVGLFGSVVGTESSPAVVENVIVSGSVQTYGGSCVAGLIGYAANAQIINCGNGAAVTNFAGEGYYSSNGAAGILGRSGGNVTISGCFNVGTIIAGGYAAGIVYDAKGDTAITNCYDMGSLNATDDGGYTGGIVAVPTVGKNISLTNCYAGGTYTATKPGAVVGTVSLAMTMSNVYYQGDKWHGSDSDSGWSDTNEAPTAFTSYSTLLTDLGSAFKANGESYPILTWQTGALTPSESTHTHSYTTTVTEPTCTEQGYTTHTCSECGYSYKSNYVEALGHVRPADSTGYTHNDNDTHSYTCSRCEEVITENCTYNDGVVTTPATTNAAGVKTYTCSVCGGTKTETIPAIDFETDEDGNYLIESNTDIARLATKVNAGTDYSGITFKLTADVALTTPIGTNTHPFKGNFIGDYHTVTISINNTAKDFNGLFGAISGATVQKVIVAGTIKGGSFTAGIAGYATDSTIRYCGNTAAITGGDNHTYGQNAGPNDCYAAGIVGYATGETRIIACYNKGTVNNNSITETTSNGGSKYTGGIVGNLYSGAVQYCYNTGAISISTAAGTSYTYTGGIAGMSWSNSIMNSYSTGTISGGNYTGGIVGSTNLYYQQGAYSYYLSTSASAGCGTGNDDPEYILSASAADLQDKSSTAGQNLGSAFVEDFDEDAVNNGYLILAWEADPNAEVGYVLDIYTAAQLHEFANNVRGGYSYEGQTVRLMNDVDLGGVYNSSTGASSNIWTAVGDVNGTLFKGTFDGQNNTISGMVIVNDDSGSLGLFSVLPYGATVKNVTVEGAISTSYTTNEEGACVGTIAGWNLGTVENCVSMVNIDAYNYYSVGGIVGDDQGTVTGCSNYGNVNGHNTSDRVGGIVGRVEPKSSSDTALIADCSNYGTVTGYQYVGGIVGAMFNEDVLNTLSLSGCANEGNVNGWYYVGGIVGKASLGELTIKDCYSKGTVTATDTTYAGKIAGDTKADIYNTYYLLDSSTLLSAGYSSGDNYSRPVSAEYMATSAFTDMVFGVEETDDTDDTQSIMLLDAGTEDSTTASYDYDGVWTVNVVGSEITVTRLDGAITNSLDGITINGTDYDIDEDDVLSDSYGNVRQATFEVDDNYDAEDVSVIGGNIAFEVIIDGVSHNLTRNQVDNQFGDAHAASNPGGLEYGAYKLLTYDENGDPIVLEDGAEYAQELIYGIAGEYITITELLGYFGVDPDSVTNMSFTPKDLDGNSDYIREIPDDIDYGDVAIALTSFQSSSCDLTHNTTPDTLNTPRLVYVEGQDIVRGYESVKWIQTVTIETSN